MWFTATWEGGKTTSAKILSSVFTGTPYDLFEAVEMRGNPQKYEEKTIARPDYGSMSKGDEKVIWLGSIGTPVLIVDELNRFSVEMQDVLLQGLDTGVWQYLNSFQKHKVPAFLTANYTTGNVNEFIPPLLDRMNIMTEEQYPGAIMDYQRAETNRLQYLCNPEITGKAVNLLNEYGINDFRFFLTKNKLTNINSISEEEKEQFRDEINQLQVVYFDEEIDENVNDPLLFFYSFVSEINYSNQFGSKRSSDPISEDNHDLSHIGSKVHTAFSPRSQKAALEYAKGLAWLTGNSRVEISHFKAVLPHIIGHKFVFNDDFALEAAQTNRNTCEELFLANELVELAHSNYLDAATDIKNVLFEVQKASEKDIDSEDTTLNTDKHDHPLSKELIISVINEHRLQGMNPEGDF